ncbi:MFS general substrate transporter [Neocallimastix californiae]|uniref:MFS general substrate transporter n=1 Tax=Neocallimastix californiae TaxID=1754190 RepID=A0A1Y2D6K4_9FUNG|nr:MFS general substrate transporter [Neocallimastix californiae]|eukprot:ORY54774.1 MFS general substrate transporter [Neocallimastix californiae]
MNKATVAIFSALLADYVMVTIIVPIINDLFKIDYGKIDEFRVGFVYSMKGLSQLCTGLLIGKISDKLQLKLMTQLGLTFDFIASLIYIFGRKFPSYMTARGIHGIGSSLIASSSFSLLANHYKTDEERGEIMSKAGTGIACGVLFGPVLGGILYSLGEKMGLESYARLVPFAFCSIADILAISGVHFFINSPYRSIKKKSKTLSSSLELDKKKKSTSSQKNLSNWQILKYVPILALVYLSFAGNLEISYIEPILPNYWMKLTDNNWNTLKSGILFGFSPLSYTIFMPILGKYGYKIGRHHVILIGMIVISFLFLIVIPNKSFIYSSAFFLFMMGCGSGAIDSSLQPMLAEAYDNLLERKKKEEKLVKEVEMDISDDKTETSLDEKNIVKLTIDIVDSKEDSAATLELEEKETENGQDEVTEEEVEEEAHNKYTRVFSLGNMAMNVGFITGPLISSFLVALVDGDEPNVNRFNSSFFKCCLIFAAFGLLSSVVAIIPGLKRYRREKDKQINQQQ